MVDNGTTASFLSKLDRDIVVRLSTSELPYLNLSRQELETEP